MPLDLRTLAFTVSLVSFNATITMVLLFILVKQYPATIYWAIGNSLSMVGFALLTGRGQISDFFSIIVANLLCALSMGITYFGIVKFIRPQHKVSKAFWLILLLLPVFLYFSIIEKSLLYRSLITSIFGATVLLLNGITLYFLSPRTQRFSHWFAGTGFLVMGLFQVFRGISLFFVNTSYGIFSENWLQVANFILSVAFIIFWTMGSVFMVTQRLSVELTQTARIDFLTQTLNRRAAQERLNQESKRAERRNGVFSIILMDVDKFKYINDHYGHSVGDAALIQISDMMRKSMRTEDMHCRWGGDEFLIMLQDTAEVGAQEVALRLKKTIHKQKIIYQNKKISCTLSIGIACFGISSRTLEETITQADEALYLAKSKGGDCIVVESLDKDQLALL
jgi:diguanylate cyclase (GGDEF)-like protein